MDSLPEIKFWGDETVSTVASGSDETVSVEMSNLISSDSSLSDRPDGLVVSDSVRGTISEQLARVGFAWLAEPASREERLARLRMYPSARNLDDPNCIYGTPCYFPPEVFRGEYQ